MSVCLLIPRCCDDWRAGVCGKGAACPVRLARERSYLYDEVRAKAPLPYRQRKALLSHWSPRIAKAICLSVYPDFRGTYEQHLWLLTYRAAETRDSGLCYAAGGSTSYAQEARQKGILFLWPYPRIEDTRLCGPSHYLYYIVRYERPRVNAILAGASRYSQRLNAKYLTEALRLNKVYAALPSGPATLKERRKAHKAAVKAHMMLSAENNIEFKAIAYGWTHLRKQMPGTVSS
jgi:hypothetical protein